MITSSELARHLNVTAASVQRYAREGKIPFLVTPGGHRRFDLEAVLKALNLTEGSSEPDP
jgi:excisionase family DNA binding protein